MQNFFHSNPRERVFGCLGDLMYATTNISTNARVSSILSSRSLEVTTVTHTTDPYNGLKYCYIFPYVFHVMLAAKLPCAWRWRCMHNTEKMITSTICPACHCSNEMLIIILSYFVQQLLASPFSPFSSHSFGKQGNSLGPSPLLRSMRSPQGGGDEDHETTEKFVNGFTYVDGNYSDAQMTMLQTYDSAYINDREHYYRAPGGKCNTTEHIETQLNRLNAAGKLTRMVHHELERSKCLWYTRTECTDVSSHTHSKTKEFRCTCLKGRAWEDGACLAYQDQPCLWDTDCVFNAKCQPPSVEDDDEDDDSDDEETTTGTHVEKGKDDKAQAVEQLLDKNIVFETGTCVCENFSACKREAGYPPFHEDNKSAKLEALLPMFILPIFHVNAFK